MATADTTKRQGRPLAQSPVAEPKVKDVIQRLQEMEMRYLYQIQHMGKAFEQNIALLQEQVKGLAEQNKGLIEVNAKLIEDGKTQAEEAKKLADQVTRMTATITSLEKSISSQPPQSSPRSYASAASSPYLVPPTLAVTPPNSSPALSSISNPSLTRTNARARRLLPSLELNLSDTQVNSENPKELQDLMNKALQATADLAQAKCTAVSNRRKERVGFIFASVEQAEMARIKEPWKNLMEHDFSQARLIRQERFKVKLTGVDKDAIGNPERGEAVAKGYVDQINDENCLTIQAMRIISQSSERQTVQLVMVCASQEEKDGLLNKGYIAIQGAMARTSEFFESDVLQCRKCGEFNHMARNCQNPEKCLNCSEQGHNATSCTKVPRCCNCLGSHHSQTRSCPVRLRQKIHRRPNEP